MSENSRLGGAKKRTPIINKSPLSSLHVWRIPSMHDAVKGARRQVWKRETQTDREVWKYIGLKPVDGDKERLGQAIEMSDRLIDEAIACDPRLARRAQWVRRDEGEHVDTALLAMGDDQPFFKRTRNIINDETKAGEPIRIVISTDDDKIAPGTAAAFIATIRIVQQFVPLEIWWQGSWLTESHPRLGYVFHVPLVQGDMDFSRLDYCIADETRDHLSFRVMTAEATYNFREKWTGAGFRAQWSHLPEHEDSPYEKFVSHTGITPSGESVARQAASWIGMESLFRVSRNEELEQSSALQRLPEQEKPYVDTRTDAEKERDRIAGEKYWREQDALKRKEANNRLKHDDE